MKRLLAVLALFLVAFLVRAGAIAATGAEDIGFGDARDYLATAKTVCTEGDYPTRGNLPFFRAPGLPLFLATATGCDPSRIARAKLAIALADALLAPLLYVLGVAVTGSPAVGSLAAIAGALHPGLVYQTTDIRSEPLFTVMLTASLAAFALARRQTRAPLLLVAGATAAMAALVRPVGLIAIAFLAVAALCDRAPLRRRLAGAALVVAGAAAALAPWTALMAQKHGELILVNDAGGYNLWRGSHPALAAAVRAETPEAYRARSVEFETVITPQVAASVESVARTPMERSREWRRRALRIVRAEPSFVARYTVWKAVDFWRPGLNRFEYPRAVAWGSAAFNLALYALAAGGLLTLRTRNRTAAALLLAWILTFWLAHVPFQVVTRFRTASLEPVLLVLAATAIAGALQRRRAAEAALEPET
ncbi:MAG TPA: hypothetical protein VGF40_20140 [Thermoanaerobaculia bacterium]